jgi:hypothetical protein
MTPLFIVLVLLHILYIILGYMFSMTSVMVYDSPNSGGIYTDFFFYSMMSTFFFAVGSTISLLYTGTYRLSLDLLLTNLSLILIGYVMVEYFQNGSFTPKKK